MYVGDGPNIVSASTVSNTELGELFRPRWLSGSELSGSLSLLLMCQRRLNEVLAELTKFARKLSEFSLPKQYSRNSVSRPDSCSADFGREAPQILDLKFAVDVGWNSLSLCLQGRRLPKNPPTNSRANFTRKFVQKKFPQISAEASKTSWQYLAPFLALWSCWPPRTPGTPSTPKNEK